MEIQRTGMTFGDALVALKQGEKVKREAWNDTEWEEYAKFLVLREPTMDWQERRSPFILVPLPKDKNGFVTFVEWEVRQGDLLAEDWQVIELDIHADEKPTQTSEPYQNDTAFVVKTP